MTALTKKMLLLSFLLLLTGAAAWAAFDLWGPRSANLRQFDPKEVAELETDMWRSYYDRERLQLFNELSALLRRQYHMPVLRSYVVAFHAAKAAFVFKDGRSRADYQRAFPDLLNYYAALRNISDTPFDATRAARLELEWWIVHRERDKHPDGDLARALAELAAEVYQRPPEKFSEHARYRAEAMLLRDGLAEQEGVTDADWQKINSLLEASWLACWKAVNPAVP